MKQPEFGEAVKNKFDIAKTILRDHFRISLPTPREPYIKETLGQSLRKRQLAASSTRFPSLIEALANDQDVDVRRIAQSRPYWKYVSENRHLLEMSFNEKRSFVSREPIESLMVFLLEETDEAILRELFQNPSVTIKTLSVYREYLNSRRQSYSDDRLIYQLDNTITIKRERILKVADIWREESDPSVLLPRVLPALVDRDEVVVKSAVNRIETLDESDLQQWLSGSTERTKYDLEILWKIVKVLQKHFLKHATDLNRQRWDRLIVDCQKELLKKCSQMITQHSAIITLMRAHCDQSESIRELAESYFSFEDMILFIQDDSSPPSLCGMLVDLLKQHPLAKNREYIETLSLHLASRRQKRLAELEQSVEASFDVLEGWESKLPAEISMATISPLIYLRDMLHSIRKLPFQNSGQSLPDNNSMEEEKNLSMWWRATLGQHHSRMKEINSRVVHLWQEAIEAGTKRQAFIRDQEKVINQLESSYKNEINCELQIACRTCLKRTCATEQFLRQTHFFAGELISFLQEREHTQKELL